MHLVYIYIYIERKRERERERERERKKETHRPTEIRRDRDSYLSRIGVAPVITGETSFPILSR